MLSMHEDIFLTCLIEAETLAKTRGSTYRDKHIVGMYRNYSFETNIDHLLERVLKSEFPIILSLIHISEPTRPY